MQLYNIFTGLKHTKIANNRFKEYYNANNWQLKIPITDFYKLDFRYQVGVFLDYLRKENIYIEIYPKHYLNFILSPSLADKRDLQAEFIFDLIYDRFYVIDYQEVELPKDMTIDIKLQEVTKRGIVSAFKTIHALKRGFNTNYK